MARRRTKDLRDKLANDKEGTGGDEVNPQQAGFVSRGGGTSQTWKLIERLTAAGGGWVGLPELADYIGGYAVATRASNAKAMGYPIENRMEYDKAAKKKLSWYRMMLD